MSWKGGGREGGKSNHTHTYTHTWATGNLLGLRQSQIQRQRQRQRHGHIKKEETSPLRETAKDNQSGERERERRGVVCVWGGGADSLCLSAVGTCTVPWARAFTTAVMTRTRKTRRFPRKPWRSVRSESVQRRALPFRRVCDALPRWCRGGWCPCVV